MHCPPASTNHSSTPNFSIPISPPYGFPQVNAFVQIKVPTYSFSSSLYSSLAIGIQLILYLLFPFLSLFFSCNCHAINIAHLLFFFLYVYRYSFHTTSSCRIQHVSHMSCWISHFFALPWLSSHCGSPTWVIVLLNPLIIQVKRQIILIKTKCFL